MSPALLPNIAKASLVGILASLFSGTSSFVKIVSSVFLLIIARVVCFNAIKSKSSSFRTRSKHVQRTNTHPVVGCLANLLTRPKPNSMHWNFFNQLATCF